MRQRWSKKFLVGVAVAAAVLAMAVPKRAHGAAPVAPRCHYHDGFAQPAVPNSPRMD